MNLSRKWLTEFVDGVSVSDIDDREFSEAMTLSGSKVETYEDLGVEINNVLVGKILSMEKNQTTGAEHLAVLHGNMIRKLRCIICICFQKNSRISIGKMKKYARKFTI